MKLRLSHLLWAAACSLASLPPALAAGSEYQLLVVACTQQDCRRLAEPRLAVRPGDRASYERGDMKLEIETLTAHVDEAEANVKVEIKAAAKRTLYMLPARVTSRTLTTLTTFVSAGTIYHVWARLLPGMAAALP